MNRFISISGAFALGLVAVPAHPSPASPALIAGALGAAPAAVARGATVISRDGKVLRKGSNGWTCMPDNPASPGPDAMCFDKVGLAWAMARMGYKTPPGATGMAYMLKGGSDASNLDPFATKPTGGWIKTGPHVMILSAEAARASGYPAGANPDTSKPYVMFAGTPFAHIMMPTK